MSVAGVSATANSSFTVVLDTSVLDSGDGACEAAQQELLREVTVGAVCSPMFIWSQRDCVCRVAHSTILDEKIAQADRGTGPNPAMLNAKAKLNTRLTVAALAPNPLGLFTSNLPARSGTHRDSHHSPT
jgi:hypothetical protein